LLIWLGGFILLCHVTGWRIPRVRSLIRSTGAKCPLPSIRAIYDGGTDGSHSCGLVRLPHVRFSGLWRERVEKATATCKDYENGSHQDMVDIVAAFHQALKADPNFGSLSESELDSAIDKVCIAHLDAKVD
jgi:hypothetical protein